MGSKKVKTTSNETATTTPNIYGPAQGPASDYYGKVSNFLGTDPQSFVTPANSLQQQAFGNAAGLGQRNWDVPLDAILTAQNSLSGIGPTTASYAPTPQAYQATNVGGVNGPNVSQAALGTLNPVTQAGYQGYSAPTLGNAQNVNLGGYDATTAGGIGQYLDNSVERVDPQSLLQNLQSYMNPYLNQVVDASAQDYDAYAGQQRAELARRGAAAGAFGGSNYGIAQGQAEGELARGRGSLLSGLRSDAFNTGAGLSNLDASRRQEAGMYNAGAANDRESLLGQLGSQIGMFNAGQVNDARAFGANANNQGQLYNAGANNDFALNRAGMEAQARQFGAGAYNTAQLANAGAANQYGLAQFDAANQNNQFNANSANTAGNLQYSNEAQNARQNAQSANDAASQIYGTTADLGKFNAQAFTDNAQFNANLGLQKANTGLNAAGLYGDVLNSASGNQRADAQLQGDLGQQLWDIQNQTTQAPLMQLLAAQGLLDPSLIAALSGQTINSSGTGTSKESGGLGASLLGGLFGLGSSAISKYSDRRLKANIVKLGELSDGLGVYEYDYVWGEHDVGVMADEVATLRPWALGKPINGFATVNYGAL